MSKKLTLPQYIDNLGVARVAQLFEVDVATVKYWKVYRSAPKPETAYEIIDKSLGVVTWQSIYEPYVQHKKMQKIANFT